MTAQLTHPPVVPPTQAVAAQLLAWSQIRTSLNALVLERAEHIQAIQAAVLCGEHVLQYGPPGVAKSYLMNLLAARISAPDGHGLRTFAILLDKTTTLAQLYGPVAVSGLLADDYRRVTHARLAEAHFALVDEIGRGNGPVKDSMLTLINERQFDNGAVRVDTPLITLFAASNSLLEDPSDAALADRLLVKLVVEPLSDAGRRALLALEAGRADHKLARMHALRRAQLAGAPPPPVPNGHAVMSEDDLFALQEATMRVGLPALVQDQYDQLLRELKKLAITVTDRRAAQALGFLRAWALQEGSDEVTEDHLPSLVHLLWTKPEQREIIRKQALRLANPVKAQVEEELARARQAFRAFEDLVKRSPAPGADEKEKAGLDAGEKIRKSRSKLDAMRAACLEQKRPTAPVDAALTQVQEWRKWIGDNLID